MGFFKGDEYIFATAFFLWLVFVCPTCDGGGSCDGPPLGEHVARTIRGDDQGAK